MEDLGIGKIFYWLLAMENSLCFKDTSKQLASALVAHLLNVLLSIILSKDSEVDPCHW